VWKEGCPAHRAGPEAPRGARAAPLLSALLQDWAYEAWGYRIGFELLIYNAAFTMAGMLLLVKRHEK